MKAAGELLPDDVILEILLRVSGADVAATLFRCAAACKRWRALVADHSFLRRRWPVGACHPSSLRGFFVRCNDDDTGSLQPFFLPPLSGSVLGSRRRSLASFIPGLPYGELDGAVPLTARHGLLLMRLARRVTDDPARLAVCNLLAGTYHKLPSLERGVFSVNCAIVTSAEFHSPNGHHRRSPVSPDHCPTFFKVLAIVMADCKNDYREWNNLYTISSAEPRWSEPRICFDVHRRTGMTLQWRNKVVVCRGMAHWLVVSKLKYYILDVSIETGHVDLLEFHIPKELFHREMYEEPILIVTAAGSPSLLWLRKNGLSLNIWTRAGDGDGTWPHARMVDLKPPKTWNPSSVHVWSGEKSGVLLIVDTFRCVHMLDIESGAIEDVSEQFRSSCGMMAVPVEIDWPTVFMSRLGGGCGG